MPLLIENPADCEIHSVIRYLSAKGVKAVEIHHNICEVYGQNIDRLIGLVVSMSDY